MRTAVAGAGCAGEFDVQVAPPPERVDVVPRRAGYRWEPGYWWWDNGRYEWNDGGLLRTAKVTAISSIAGNMTATTTTFTGATGTTTDS